MRDAAIVRATVRELAPLHLGALAIGMLVALASMKDFQEASDSPNTWPLVVLPVAALWGALGLGGGTKASLVHLLSRPVGRLRLLAWRWALLLFGLAIVALPLWWIGLHQFARGPGLWWIAIATALASAFGFQGATLSDREPNALAGALLLGGSLALPMQLALEAEQLTWTRVNDTMGWLWLLPLALALALLAIPVAWSWARVLPVRGIEAGARTVVASLGASLVLVGAVIGPMLDWVEAPERGELLAVVTMTSDGLLVATGTRGEGGERDIVDGLVVIADDGERRTIWDRETEAPESTVWFVMAMDPPFDDAIHLALVDGPEPSAEHPLRDHAVAIEQIADTPDAAALRRVKALGDAHWDLAFGIPDAPLLVIDGNVLATFDPVAAPERRVRRVKDIRATELRLDRRGGFAVAHGRVWAVIQDGSLWSAPVPWEVQP